MNIVYQTKQINTPSIVTQAGTALAANTERRGWSIQNVGTNPLFICLGATASSSVFHWVIKGGSGDSDGLGGIVSQTDGTVFTGLITVAGTTPKFTVMEM